MIKINNIEVEVPVAKTIAGQKLRDDLLINIGAVDAGYVDQTRIVSMHSASIEKDKEKTRLIGEYKIALSKLPNED